MSAKWVPLLSVFVGGCLSGAGALTIFYAGEKSARTEAATAREAAPPPHETSVVVAVQHAVQHESEPAPSRTDVKAEAEVVTEPGSSVADVLVRLETAYRQELAAAPPVSDRADDANDRALSHDVPVPEQRVAPPADATPPSRIVQAEPDPAPAPAARREPAPVAREEAAPIQVAVREVNQNIHVGDVHHGDVVHTEQQLAVIQYIQLLGLYGAAPLARPGPTPQTPRPRGRHVAPFSMPLTNPDNPWGFDFPPTVLAK